MGVDDWRAVDLGGSRGQRNGSLDAESVRTASVADLAEQEARRGSARDENARGQVAAARVVSPALSRVCPANRARRVVDDDPSRVASRRGGQRKDPSRCRKGRPAPRSSPLPSSE